MGVDTSGFQTRTFPYLITAKERYGHRRDGCQPPRKPLSRVSAVTSMDRAVLWDVLRPNRESPNSVRICLPKVYPPIYQLYVLHPHLRGNQR